MISNEHLKTLKNLLRKILPQSSNLVLPTFCYGHLTNSTTEACDITIIDK